MSEKKVLHLFNDYLPQTENWSYKLMRNTPETRIFIGARAYLKNNFYDSNFTFLDHPFGGLATFYASRNTRKISGVFQKLLLKMVSPFFGSLESQALRFAKEKQIDIIHAHFADVAWYFRKIPQKLGIPFVISFYGWDYEQLPTVQPIFKERYQILFTQATAIICEGDHGAEILKKMACPPAKIKVVPLGVEPGQIPFYHRKKQKKELHLLQLATFTEKKGQIYTVRAFEKALAACPNMTLTLIGGTAQAKVKEEVVQYIETKALKDKVKIFDSIDYATLYTRLKDFQIFIHPSCYAANRDCEGGAPIVLLDAQATGMPVISTRHCDIPMEVLHEKTGLLAAEKNVEELAQHIQTFYEMEESQYHQYGQEARAHVQEHFDSQKNAQKLKTIYDTFG